MEPKNGLGLGATIYPNSFRRSRSLLSRWPSSVRPFTYQDSQMELLIRKPRKAGLRTGSPLFKLGNIHQI